MKKNKLKNLFDLVMQEFEPDEKAMSLFINSCFSEDEIKNKIVLDAGCGSGIAGRCFTKRYAKKVMGIDISEKSVSFANKRALLEQTRNINFLRADLSNLPFKDNFFDIVFTVGVLPYIENINESIRELTRVLAEDGTILILSLKKTKWDSMFETMRRIFANIPSAYTLKCSKVLSILTRPISPLILKRNEIKGGKTLQQTIIEAFFSPVRLKRYSPDEMKRQLAKENVETTKLIPPYLNFCSPSTVFIIKGVKRKWEGKY